ncbi:unnamed protein product [Ambrosiozyma monospora]|uniref:Unnamed protein product n=1 Tax=Ambrosiozyma monospora TaxID=43982 RepID=A0A9W6YW33_AMBMO|nr:unnamed protein product [Ambrosiozyma monospora]
MSSSTSSFLTDSSTPSSPISSYRKDHQQQQYLEPFPSSSEQKLEPLPVLERLSPTPDSSIENLPEAISSTLQERVDTSEGNEKDNLVIRWFGNKKLQFNSVVLLYLIAGLFNATVLLLIKLLLRDSSTISQSENKGDTLVGPSPSPSPDNNSGDGDSQGLQIYQIVFIKSLITLILSLLYMLTIQSVPDLPFGPNKYRKCIWLGVMGGTFATIAQITALVKISVSDAITISFLNVICITSIIGAFLFFMPGVKIYKFEIWLGILATAVVFTLLGKGDGDRSKSCLFALCATFGTSISFCSIKKVGFHANQVLFILFYSICTCIVSASLGFATGFSINDDNHRHFLSFDLSSEQYGYLFALGLTEFLMFYMMNVAIQREKKFSKNIGFMFYSSLIFGLGFDWLVLNDVPRGGLRIMGQTVLIGCVLCVLIFKPSYVDEEELVPEQYEYRISSSECGSFKDDEAVTTDFAYELEDQHKNQPQNTQHIPPLL